MDSDDAGHDVDDPLWVDDYVALQELRVEEDDGTQVVEELDGLDHLNIQADSKELNVNFCPFIGT